MKEGVRSRRLDGDRLHLSHGPIDLIIGCNAMAEARAMAFAAASARLEGLLETLCAELPVLRRPPGAEPPSGTVARRMWRAVKPFAVNTFVTPMAAVAGAVADEIIAAMTAAAPLARAYVNNGGDIALYLAHGSCLAIGLIDRPDRPSVFAKARIEHGDPVRGIATSGWRGRSHSLGIADSVTVLAASGAAADAAATLIANAVDLPGHPAIRRLPACTLQPDSDLGARLVTCDVGPLRAREIAAALEAGAALAESFRARGHIVSAALQLAGAVRIVGAGPLGPDMHMDTVLEASHHA